jgi:hypothetical protein
MIITSAILINPRDLIITSADGLGDNQISGVDKNRGNNLIQSH